MSAGGPGGPRQGSGLPSCRTFSMEDARLPAEAVAGEGPTGRRGSQSQKTCFPPGRLCSPGQSPALQGPWRQMFSFPLPHFPSLPYSAWGFGCVFITVKNQDGLVRDSTISQFRRAAGTQAAAGCYTLNPPLKRPEAPAQGAGTCRGAWRPGRATHLHPSCPDPRPPQRARSLQATARQPILKALSRES